MSILMWDGIRAGQIWVRPGFITDFATVPWFAQWLIPRTGKWTLPATAHDVLCELLNERHRRVQAVALGLSLEVHGDRRGARCYSCRRVAQQEVPPVAYGPVDTDAEFRDMLRHENTDWTRRWLIWTAVRLGAIANPARRVGWWRSLHRVAAVSAAVLVVVAGAAYGSAWSVAQVLGWI